MIQRIQSLYLILIAIISGGLVFVFPLWIDNNQLAFYVFDALKSSQFLLISLAVVFLMTALLAVISLLLFKNRKNQFVINRINLILNLYLLGLLLYYLQNLSGETFVSEKGIGALFPVLNIVLLVFANKAIQKDEALVKSVDRLR